MVIHRLLAATALAMLNIQVLQANETPLSTTPDLEASQTSSESRPDVISTWSTATSQLANATGMNGFRVAISLGLVHLAMYDAVQCATRTHSPYLASNRARHRASAYAAAVEAGYRVLLAEFPTQQAALTTTRTQLLAELPPSPAHAEGLTLGAAVAQQLLAGRATDGRNAPVAYTPGMGPGVWVPTPPAFLPAAAPFLAHVQPFTLTRPDQFRPDGPPALGSTHYADDYEEVKLLGAKNSETRTAEQTANAWFWEPVAGTVWPATIRRLAAERSLSLGDSARFQAAAFAAYADALIGCWDAKYHYNFWRPITAIAQADADGNEATDPDTTWEPLAATPPFPEYPSGHACVSAAVPMVIEDFFRHRVRIPARNVVTGEERFYTRARDITDEVIEARMLIGVHFRTANEDGAEIGRRVAQQIRSRYFRPRHRD